MRIETMWCRSIFEGLRFRNYQSAGFSNFVSCLGANRVPAEASRSLQSKRDWVIVVRFGPSYGFKSSFRWPYAKAVAYLGRNSSQY